MLIKRVRIQNFRGLEDVDIPFDSVTTFIGPNGVGKSTVLQALEWFFNGVTLTDEDVLSSAAEPWIRVEVEFSCLTLSDRKALGKYARGSRDTVKIWRIWDKGEVRMTGRALAFAPFEEIRAQAKGKRTYYDALRKDRTDLALPPWSNEAAMESFMFDWEDENPGFLTESDSDDHFFGFNGPGLMSELFSYVLVTADLRASEEAQDTRSSLLGRILERAVDRTPAEDELQRLTDRFLQEQGDLHKKHFGSQLDVISDELSDAVFEFAKGRSVRIDTDNAVPRPQKIQFKVSIKDGGAETKVERQGHGFQRALLIAALKLLANRSETADQQSVICLAIEEPELFQHPVQARAFASVLRKLAEKPGQRVQVTYATHSPVFVEAPHFAQVRRVSRRKTDGSPTPRVEISAVSHDRVKQHLEGTLGAKDIERRMERLLYNDQLREALFAETVILVEGATDQGVLEGCAERDGTPLEVHGIVTVEARGKGDMFLPHAILTLLGIPCYLVFDGDRGGADRIRAKSYPEKTLEEKEQMARDDDTKSRAENRKILRYLGAPEEDWPSTGAYDTYAVYEDCLEEELANTWPTFDERREQLIDDGLGFPGKHTSTYRRSAIEADTKAPGVFLEILAAVRSLRASAV